MPAPRRRPLLDESTRAALPAGQAVSVVVGEGDGEKAATLARTAVALAAASQGAAAVITRNPAVGAAFRGARDLGVEPRISLPSPGPSLSARTPLTLALQGPRASPAFAAAASFVADFVSVRAAAPGGSADPALRAKLLQVIAKAREASRAGLDFAAIGALAATSLGSANHARVEVAKAFALLERAEAAARLFASPVGWDVLLSPSPTGRRAAVLIGLGRLPPSDAELVEGLALASLAASLQELKSALEGGPVLLVADQPTDALGRYAAERLASWAAEESPAVFALFLTATPPVANADFPEAVISQAGLVLPGREAPLPLTAAPEPWGQLSDAELRVLTPPALRSRLLGSGAPDEEDAAADPAQALAPSPSAALSQRALREAAGNLEAIAKRRSKPGEKPTARGSAFEASEFEL